MKVYLTTPYWYDQCRFHCAADPQITLCRRGPAQPDSGHSITSCYRYGLLGHNGKGDWPTGI